MTAELVCAATDPAWLERRREGITATDIVTIAGLVTWDSPWALYHRKLGLLPEVEQSDRMRLGSWLERAIADTWGCIPHTPSGRIDSGGLYRSTVRTWQMATPDRVIVHWQRDQPATAGEILTGASMSGLLGGPPGGKNILVAVLECKTSATRQGWGEDGSDVVPAHVRAQVLWQMDTLGVGVGHVAVVFLPSGEFRSYTIRHDDAPPHSLRSISYCDVCIEIDELRTMGERFWRRLQDKEPPDLDGLEVTTDALRVLHPAPGGQVEIRETDLHLWDMEQTALARTTKNMNEAKNYIRALMGDAHEATVNGRVVFRRTISKRAGYTVPPGETDTLRRVGKDKADAD